jgi:hypothetical protein
VVHHSVELVVHFSSLQLDVDRCHVSVSFVRVFTLEQEHTQLVLLAHPHVVRVRAVVAAFDVRSKAWVVSDDLEGRVSR